MLVVIYLVSRNVHLTIIIDLKPWSYERVAQFVPSFDDARCCICVAEVKLVYMRVMTIHFCFCGDWQYNFLDFSRILSLLTSFL